MTTKSESDEFPVTQAQPLYHPATEKATPRTNLAESAQHQHQLEILDLFGAIDFDPNYDYKKNRQLDRIECRVPHS